MDRQVNRWMVWTGPLYTVVFVIALFALEGETPGEKASAGAVVDFYNGHQGRTMGMVFLAPLLATLLVLFASHVRTMVRDRHLVPGPGPTVMLAGSVLWAGGILIGATTSLATLSAADHGQDQVAQTMNVLNNSAWLPFIAGIAVTMVGAGLTVLGTHLLRPWMGWIALVTGVVSLAGPGGFVGWFVAPIWLLVAGVMLAREPVAAAVTEPAVAPDRTATG
jgi:hypothetical protein